MKTVLLHEYNAKKIIADNLAIITGNSRYKNISDAEFARINNAIDTYNQSAQTEYDGLHDLAQIEQQNSELTLRVEQLESIISNISYMASDDIIEVEEDGFYFTDEYGRIGAKIINTGFYAINSNNSSEGSSVAVGKLGDLTDVSIISPVNGQSLMYNSVSGLWKNTTTGGSISGDFTIVDY